VVGRDSWVPLGLDEPTATVPVKITVTGHPAVGRIGTADGEALILNQSLSVAEQQGLRYRGGDRGEVGGGLFTYDVLDGTGSMATGSVQVETRPDGGALYFHASDGSTGDELWRVTAEGQVEQVADIEPGPGGSSPIGFTEFEGPSISARLTAPAAASSGG